MLEHAHSHTPTLTLDHNVLRYEKAWSLPLKDLRLIGEYTTSAGPAGEDYFIVFVDREGSSYNAPGIALEERLARQLTKRYGELTFELLGSTRERNRIVWPEHVRGAALYTYKPLPSHGLADRVRRLFGTRNVEIDLSPTAASVVDEDSPRELPKTAMKASYPPVMGSKRPPEVGARQIPAGAMVGNARHRR